MIPGWNTLRQRLFDERFVRHRYQSTSHAAVAAALILGGWTLVDLHLRGVVRWDFLAVMAVMAVVKLGFLAWYQLRD